MVITDKGNQRGTLYGIILASLMYNYFTSVGKRVILWCWWASERARSVCQVNPRARFPHSSHSKKRKLWARARPSLGGNPDL